MYIKMYIMGMAKLYSIADARRNLPSLVDEAEAGAEVQLTRRGRPVAVVLSVAEYENLKYRRAKFGEAFAAFRDRFPADSQASQGISRRDLRGLRDRSAGRKVEL